MVASGYGAIDKVSKTGDTMTGPLILSGATPLQVTTTSPGAGKVLVSDASGNVSWGTAGSAGVTVPLTLAGGQASSSVLTVQNTAASPSIAALVVTSQAAGDRSFGVQVAGDTNRRMMVDSNGVHSWGPGSAAGDTNLYRSAAGTLKTDNSLTVGTNLTVSGTTTATGNVTASGNITVGGHAYATDPVNGGQETWHPMALQSGWTNLGGTNAVAAYKLLPDNTVLLVGNITGGTTSASTVIIAALPAAYTPAHFVHFPIALFGVAPVAGTEGYLNTSGQVIISATSGATRVDFSAVIPLDA